MVILKIKRENLRELFFTLILLFVPQYFSEKTKEVSRTVHVNIYENEYVHANEHGSHLSLLHQGAEGVIFFTRHNPLPPFAVARLMVQTNGDESMRATRCGWQRVVPGF